MYAYKDLLELAGLTTRLYTLISTLHNLPKTPESKFSSDDSFEIRNVDVVIPGSGEYPSQSISLPQLCLSALSPPDLVWLISAFAGETTSPLVESLSFRLAPHEHLMITGSNGVGKTAIARVLAGLWPPAGSNPVVLTPPDAHPQQPQQHPSVFVVPQRAYMVAGSLLDQVIYPHTYADFVRSGRTLDELEEILEKVFLTYLPEREGGWTTRKEWRDVLSGGEKQRVCIFLSRSVRLNVANPSAHFLDEFSASILSPSEIRDTRRMYKRCIERCRRKDVRVAQRDRYYPNNDLLTVCSSPRFRKQALITSLWPARP